MPQDLVSRFSVPLSFVVTPQIAAALEDASNDTSGGGATAAGGGGGLSSDHSGGTEGDSGLAGGPSHLPAMVSDEFHRQLLSGRFLDLRFVTGTYVLVAPTPTPTPTTTTTTTPAKAATGSTGSKASNASNGSNGFSATAPSTNLDRGPSPTPSASSASGASGATSAEAKSKAESSYTVPFWALMKLRRLPQPPLDLNLDGDNDDVVLEHAMTVEIHQPSAMQAAERELNGHDDELSAAGRLRRGVLDACHRVNQVGTCTYCYLPVRSLSVSTTPRATPSTAHRHPPPPTVTHHHPPSPTVTHRHPPSPIVTHRHPPSPTRSPY